MQIFSSTFGRRSLLLGGAAMATAAAGCSIDTGTPSAKPTAAGSEAAAEFVFDTTGVKLPTDKVAFRWLDSGDLKAKYLDPVIASFGEQHSNVTVTYDGAGWDQVNQVVPLGIRNGSAPDVFALPQNVPPQTAIAEGWVQPLDSVIPNFDKWRAAFPDTALIPGIHVFDGKVYSWPLNSTRRLEKMLFTSTDLADKAGVDPDAIKTWDDFRDAAKKLTGAGKPGYLVTGDHLWVVAMYLANTAGWRGVMTDGLDMLTGKYSFASDEFISAVEFLKSLVADGSVVPGYLTLKDADARAQFPAGIAGSMFNGPWDLRAWKEKSPDFAFTLNPLPSPEGKPYHIPFAERGANQTWLYAKTPIPEVAGVILNYLGSVEGQTKMVELTQGTLVSMIPEANESVDHALLDPNAKKAAELARELMRAAPQLELRTADAGKIKMELKPVEPGLQNVMQGIMSGQLPDAKKALAELDGKLQAALEGAFTAAKAAGADADFQQTVFPNWDPSKEYTQADYDALG